jgi:hypothetical protein
MAVSLFKWKKANLSQSLTLISLKEKRTKFNALLEKHRQNQSRHQAGATSLTTTFNSHLLFKMTLLSINRSFLR